VDTRMTRAVIRAGEPLAEIVIVAGHPTLVPRGQDVLDPDYPGAAPAPIWVVQGAVGNASVAKSDELSFAIAHGGSGTPQSSVRLSWSRVEAHLPRPDAARLVPSFTRAAGDNFLCASASKTAEVDRLELGPLVLVTVPGEPTMAAATPIEQAAGATRVVALTNGYLSYVESEENVRANRGEAERQYFGPELVRILVEAAALSKSGR
jgi:neutral ceramidase